MESLTHPDRLRRARFIAKWFGLSGLAILLGGLFASFNPRFLQWSFPALILGITLSQIGIYHANKYVKRPRPDEVLDAALKGLGKGYRFYHYYLPVEHVLLCPYGILVFRPKAADGRVTYDGRWRQNFNLLRFFQGLSRDRLGNPTTEVSWEVRKAGELLRRGGLAAEEAPVHGFVVFTDPRLDLRLEEEPPYPAYPAKRYKDSIRRWLKEQKAISNPTRRQIQEVLDARAGLGG